MAQYQLDGKTKFVYGLGAAPFGIKENGFSYFLLIFYSQVLGLQPFLTSLALTLAIVVDAITNEPSKIGANSGSWTIEHDPFAIKRCRATSAQVS